MTLKETIGAQDMDLVTDFISIGDEVMEHLKCHIHSRDRAIISAIIAEAEGMMSDCDKCDRNTSGNDALNDLITSLKQAI